MSTEFETMVNEVYEHLNVHSKGELLILPKIDVDINTTRLHWKNVKEYLKVIKRHPDHFLKFLRNELPGKSINWFSGSKSDGLIFLGKFQKQQYIITLIKKYIDVYVICPSCKLADTMMNKEEFHCNDCGFKKYLE
jgi:translation initiation factor 2 beta subunit (eIF-2beta)/eIF-5